MVIGNTEEAKKALEATFDKVIVACFEEYLKHQNVVGDFPNALPEYTRLAQKALENKTPFKINSEDFILTEEHFLFQSDIVKKIKQALIV